MALTDLAQGIISLVPQVSRMRSELDDLAQQMKVLEERVFALEHRDDLTAEKARNAALQATIEVTQRLSETDRIARG